MADYFSLRSTFFIFSPLIINLTWPISVRVRPICFYISNTNVRYSTFLSCKNAPTPIHYTSTLDDANTVSLSVLALGHRVSCTQCKRARKRARTHAPARTHAHMCRPVGKGVFMTHILAPWPYVFTLLRIYWGGGGANHKSAPHPEIPWHRGSPWPWPCPCFRVNADFFVCAQLRLLVL